MMEFWILPDKIFVSLLALVDNQLGVIQHKATEQKQTTIQLKLLRKCTGITFTPLMSFCTEHDNQMQ